MRHHGKWRRLRMLATGLGAALAVWFVAAYLVLPRWWEVRERHHPALDAAPTLTTTGDGHPGDPLNLFIIAAKDELIAAMLKSGWYPADPVTLKSSIRIAEDAALRRPYDDAPVSALRLFGRKQDLAFEKPVGHDPRERHHVRFWQAPETAGDHRAAWWGAATFDRSVGFSHTTGEITHHISDDVDAERDLVLAGLRAAGFADIQYRGDFQQPSGKNGGGDPWHSDGKLGIASRR